MSDQFNVNVSLSIKTCFCGSVYAVPYWLKDFEFSCPLCSHRTIISRNDEINELVEHATHLNKVINGLRGALKRK